MVHNHIKSTSHRAKTDRSDAVALIRFAQEREADLRPWEPPKPGMEEAARKSHEQEFELIESIPGIGAQSAARILTATGGISKFATPSALVSFLGLDPGVKESGTSVKGKGAITKQGNAHARAALYNCSVPAARFNAPCRALYDRLAAKRKPARKRFVAVAAKLARTIWGVCHTGTMWREE
jgi:transposase